MQRIDLICVGKLNAAYCAEGVAEYQKRLKGLCEFRIIELPEEKIEEKNASDAVVKKALEKEGKAILSNVRKGAAILAVDAVFVQLSLGKAGHKAAPHAGVGLLHGNARPPAVKATADLHSHSTRGPHGKPPALLPKVIPAGVRAQHTVGIKAFARKERAVDGGKIHADFSFSQRDTPGHIYQ